MLLIFAGLEEVIKRGTELVPNNILHTLIPNSSTISPYFNNCLSQHEIIDVSSLFCNKDGRDRK
jgi:hypothetical protein